MLEDDILELEQVLPIFEYDTKKHLLESLKTEIIDLVIIRAGQLDKLKNKG